MTERYAGKKLGQFEISGPVIAHDPGLVRLIMGQCIIIRAEAYFGYDSIRYMAISDHFDVVDKHKEIPWYEIEATIGRGKDGVSSFEFKKREAEKL